MMTYFDCFVVGSWMFVTGWFLGAIYVQSFTEKTESSDVTENLEIVIEAPEPCPQCEAWRLPRQQAPAPTAAACMARIKWQQNRGREDHSLEGNGPLVLREDF